MENKITQAVLLSAGFGTRIRSLLPDIPKVMAPLLGKPLLEWHIEELKKHGVGEFFINLHYKPEVIRNHFGDGSQWGVKITYAMEEPEILGTAGGVKNFSAPAGGRPASDREGGSDLGGDGPYLRGDFFVLYADTFYRIDYGRLARFYASLKNPIGVATVRKTDHPMDSDLAIVDADNRIVEFRLKPHKELPKEYWGSSAPYIFSTKILEYIPSKKYYEIDHDLVPDLLARGYAYYAYPIGEGEFRKDVGTPERYKEVEEYLKKQSQK